MNEFVASRGLFPLLLSPAHRFPFYDGVFDLVHVGTAALDEAGAPAMGQAATPEALEFFMFDVDRVLRAGGLLWIDSYLCQSEERRRVVAKLIERFGYKKLKWVAGEKAGVCGRGWQMVYTVLIFHFRKNAKLIDAVRIKLATHDMVHPGLSLIFTKRKKKKGPLMDERW
uniref:Methyltransferase type 11 domain-containing protein n=1 Tax=Aegilops tauschii TaxID=37682 RepID=R7VZ77_AEGTA